MFPVGADQQAGMVALKCLAEIKTRCAGSRTVIGLSNISFGLPRRPTLNSIFTAQCMAFGLNAAIIDPTDGEVIKAVRTADALLGNDKFCMAYMKWHRQTMNS